MEKSVDPFINLAAADWSLQGEGAASWIDCPGRSLAEPSVALLRLRFKIQAQATVTICVSADNRYRLFLDGKPQGRGPERGDPLHWRYESYRLELPPGEHLLLAQTWWLGELAPYAQMSVRPGFLLAETGPLEEVLSTGLAPWEARLFPGREFLPPTLCGGTGARERIDGKLYPWGWETGQGGCWQPAEPLCKGMSATVKNEIPPYWLLTPATLPPMLEEIRTCGRLRHLGAEKDYPLAQQNHLAVEAPAWDALLDGRAALTIGPHSRRCAIIDLEEYRCAYPQLVASGGAGAKISLKWAESLYEGKDRKGDRNQVEGKSFLGEGDEFLPDGGSKRFFTTLWWRAGRYLELDLQTQAEAVTLESFNLLETRYPLKMEGEFASSDSRLEQVVPIALRGLQMCAHETYMDCPYYEQLMYVGDARLEALVTYVLTADTRLVSKALRCFADSRRLSGLTQSRFPSRVTQIIPPFSLWWVSMVHDYFLWRDDPDFVRQLLPAVRGVMEYFRTRLTPRQLMSAPEGWNFVDWTGWKWGVPPKGDFLPSSILNLQFILALSVKAELEEFYGEDALAERDRQQAGKTFGAVWELFWDDKRGLLADDLGKQSFSEHAQVLALLTGLADRQKQAKLAAGLTSEELTRTTIYFTHYLFEVYYQLGRADLFWQRLSLWFGLQEAGFKTTFERPEPCRSDCHGWGSHPLYHFYASLLGIRPQTPGFKSVLVRPLLGSLSWLQGTLPHPKGKIEVRLKREDSNLQASILLPAGVPGVFSWEGKSFALAPGRNHLTVESNS